MPGPASTIFWSPVIRRSASAFVRLSVECGSSAWVAALSVAASSMNGSHALSAVVKP